MPGHHGKSGSSLGKSQGGQNNRERGADRNRNQTLSPDVRARNKAAMDKVKADQGRDKLSNYQVGKVPGFGPVSFVLNAGQDLRQKSFEYNRDFFRNKVLKSKNRGGYVDTFDSYKDYITSRGAGKIDAYGNPNPGYGNDRNPTILETPTSGVVTAQGVVPPNEVEAQAVALQKEEEKQKANAMILAKRRGNLTNIRTSAQGLTDEDLTISKKTLLG